MSCQNAEIVSTRESAAVCTGGTALKIGRPTTTNSEANPCNTFVPALGAYCRRGFFAPTFILPGVPNRPHALINYKISGLFL